MGLINIVVSSCSAANDFCCFKSKGLWQKGPELGEELRWGDLQICYPCGAWRAGSSNCTSGSRCFPLPSLEIPYLFTHCFSEVAATLPCQGSGMSKVSRRTGVISLRQAMCCPRRPSTSPWSGAGLHLWKEITSPCEPYFCCITPTRANLINTEETSWEQLSARIDLSEERENYNQYFRIIWGKFSR